MNINKSPWPEANPRSFGTGEMMKHIGILIVVVILTLAGCNEETSMTEEATPSQDSPGVGLRQMALTTPANKLGFTADEDFPTVYGVLTDWDIGGNTATIMSMRDGTASLYTTSKFGVIGGQGHESVRRAAARYVKVAEQFAKSGKITTDFPYPKRGQVYYYLLTYDGVQQVIGNEAAIERGSDSTGPLFAAAQDVLTELRLITEEENTQPENSGD